MKMFESAQFLKLKFGLVNYGPWVTSGPLPFFLNEILLEVGKLFSLWIVYGFHITNINYMDIFRKYLLTPSLNYI